MTQGMSLRNELLRRGAREGVERLAKESDEEASRALADRNPDLAVRILWELPEEKRLHIMAFAPTEKRTQWVRNHEYPEGTVGRLMDPPIACFSPQETVADVV